MEIQAFNDLQTLFSERFPYAESRRLGETLIVFSHFFLRNLREAFTNGCMLKMSEDEFNLANDYVDYVDGIKEATPVLLALDEVLVDIVNCTYVDKSNECTLNSVYEFNECGV